MGNLPSTLRLIDEEVKVRSNLSSSYIPLPEQAGTLQETKDFFENRNLLVQNFDSVHLSSLLFEDVDDSSLSSRVFSAFKSLPLDEAQQIRSHHENLRNCSLSRLKVKLREILWITESNCALAAKLKIWPHVKSMHTQIAMYYILSDYICKERDFNQLCEQKRTWSAVTLSSLSNPELKTMLSWQRLGINMLKMFSQSMDAKLEVNETAIKCIEEFCGTLSSTPDLSLFNSWSPRNRRPIKKLDISKCLLNSSLGDSSTNKLPITTCWSSPGGWLSITLQSPQRISYLQMNWAPTRTECIDKMKIGEPNKVFIFIRTKDSNSGEEGELVEHCVVEPEVFRTKHRTWEHLYPIDKDDVCEVRLLFSQETSDLNPSNTTRLYGVELLVEEEQSCWVNALSLLEETQSALIPLFKFSALQASSLHAHISLLRSSASLGLCLRFARFLIDTPSDQASLFDVKNSGAQDLFESINNVYLQLRNEYDKIFISEKLDLKVNFSPTSGDGTRSLMVTDSQSISNYLEQELTEGDFEWVIEVENSQEALFLGVASKSTNLVDSTKDSTTFLINTSTGNVIPNIWQSGKDISNIQYPRIFNFKFTSSSRMVHLECNGETLGVVFESVPLGSFPCVLINNCKGNCSVHLKYFTKRLQTWDGVKSNRLQNSVMMEFTNGGYVTNEDWAFTLLRKLGELATTRMAQLLDANDNKTRSNLLEYQYCVEVSLDVINLLCRLLEDLILKQVDNAILLSLLSLLDAQLLSLGESQYSLRAVELTISEQIRDEMNSVGDESWQSSCNLILKQTKLFISQLIKPHSLYHSQLCLAAMKTFCYGMKAFTNSCADQIEAAAMIIQQLKSELNQQSPFIDENWTSVLAIIINSMCDYNNVSLIVEQIDSVDTKKLLEIITSIIVTMFEADKLLVTKVNIDHSGNKKLLEGGANVLIAIFEQLMSCLLKSERNSQKIEQTFCSIVESLLVHCSNLLYVLPDEELSRTKMQHLYLIKLSFPLLCSLATSNLPLATISTLMPKIVKFLDQTNTMCIKSSHCRETLKLVSAQIKRDRNSNDIMSSEGGWKTLKASFEDSDSSFTITENGTLYTSVHSGNTCAIVPIKFGPGQRAAWEFLLESDSQGDECSIFGAARMPLSSRCYSSSPDLWMRRSYNGYMYCQGHTSGNNLDKIHPGDTVRIEFDGTRGTLSYSVNGADPDIGFSDINDEIYPSCGSYRNGVGIKLLKVEVFERSKVSNDSDDLWNHFRLSNATWVYSGSNNFRDPTILSRSTGSDNKKSEDVIGWLSARSTVGARFGTHDFSLEFGNNYGGNFCVGVVLGHTLPDDIPLASNLLISSKATMLLRPLDAAIVDNMYGDLSSFGLDCNNVYFQRSMSVFAWRSDGSLWFNGVQVAEKYGIKFLPLKRFSSIILRISRSARSLEIIVNGQSAGIAFGSEGKCKILLPPCETKFKAKLDDSESQTIFPCCSIYGKSLTVKIKVAGAVGSVVLPTTLQLRHTLTNVISRLISKLMEGNGIGFDEEGVVGWLQSPLFIGGIDHKFASLFSGESWIQDLLPASSLNLDQADLTLEDSFAYSISCSDSSVQLSEEVKALYESLEQLDPDPATLKLVLERSGTYRFPQCELPFIACLLRQGGLIREVLKMMASVREGAEISASEDMFLLWQKVKQLRVFLRQKRQKLRSGHIAHKLDTPIVEEVEEASAESKSDKICDRRQYCCEQMVKKGFSFVNSIIWYSQLDASCANKDGSSLSVLEYGLDLKHELAFVISSITYGKGVQWEDALLQVDGHDISTPTTLKIKDEGHDVLVVHKFSIANFPNSDSFDNVKFSVSKGGYDAISMKTNNGLCVGKDAEKNSNEFDDLCNSIRGRALLVLLLHTSTRHLDSHTKSVLLGLTSKYSGASGLFKSKAELTKWRTQERWKRVIEFLRVQSKAAVQDGLGINKSHSISLNGRMMNDSDDVEIENNGISTLVEFAKDCVSNSQAILQACAVFVLSEDIKCSVSSLVSIIKSRTTRANFRINGLQILHESLTKGSLGDDPMVVYDLISRLENVLPACSAIKKGSKHTVETEDSHYLKQLEGCHSTKLIEVQQAFSRLYSALSAILAHYLTCWDQSFNIDEGAGLVLGPLEVHDNKISYPSHIYLQPMQQIIRLWTMHYSNRDFGWILSCGMLPNLYKVVSLSFHEKIASKWRDMSQTWLEAAFDCHSESDKIKLWPQDFVVSSITDKTMSSRALWFHLKQVMRTNDFSEEDQTKLIALDDDIILPGNNVIGLVTAKYCELQLLYNRLQEKVLADERMKESVKVEMDSKINQERIDRLLCCGMFDSSRIPIEIELEELNMVASLLEDESGIAICAYSNLCYDVNTDLSETGNYFEVTVIKNGHGDIGIGLADNNTCFPVRDQMPGWVEHSYGYHGDDGKKYGENATPGDWPLFEAGDIIGCGFNKIKRSIYYTRNGVDLGEGFTNVLEDKLWPVVGFSNRHSDQVKVRINFGLEPFAYSSESIKINSKVVSEIDRRKLEGISPPPAESLIANDVEGKGPLQYYNYLMFEADAQLFELQTLQNTANQLLQYLLIICSEKDHDNTFDASHDEKKGQVLSKVVLVKDFSTFGTPKAITLADESRLNESIIAAMLHEIRIASTYISQANSGRISSILAIEDNLLGYEVEAHHNSKTSILELPEVQASLLQHLFALCSLVESSRLVRDELSTVKSLRCLFSCFECCYAVQRVVMGILLSIIPSMDPETVEIAILPEWKNRLTAFDTLLEKCGDKKKLRRMPDSIFRIMWLEASKLYTFSANMSHPAFASSEYQFATHWYEMKLAQKLFEAPQWCELVASAIAEALRHSLQIIELKECLPLEDQSSVLMYSSTALSTFRLLPAEVIGSEVEIDGYGNGLLVTLSDQNDKVGVVLASNIADFHCRQNIEFVEKRKVKFTQQLSVVDLSQMSQPVLTQMMHLAKLCSNELLICSPDATFTDLKSIPSLRQILRLSQCLFSTLYTLLSNQTEALLEFLHEADLITDLIRIAKLPAYFPSVISFDTALEHWLFMQRRCLDGIGFQRNDVANREGKANHFRLTPEDNSDTPPNGEVPATSTESSSIIEIGHANRRERQADLQSLSNELGINIDVCHAVAEYYNLDIERAKIDLERMIECDKSFMEASFLKEGSKDSKNTVLDENPIKGIEHANLESESETQQYKYFRRLSIAVGSDLKPGDCLIESTAEGVDNVSSGPVYNFSSYDGDYFLVDQYCEEYDMVIRKLVKSSGMRRVLFYDLQTSDYERAAISADWATSVLAVRNLVLKLVICGDIDLSKRISNLSEAVALLKLILVSAGDKTNSLLRNVCKSLSCSSSDAKEESNSGRGQFIAKLVQDASENLSKIVSRSVMDGKDETEEVGEECKPLLIRSSHPYTTPYATSGIIKCPPRSTGLQIKFHPSCSTASEQAKLSLYTSEESFKNDIPHYVFTGPDWSVKYKDVQVTSDKHIFYRFNAEQNSNWPKILLDSAGSSIKKSKDKISVVCVANSSRVGLGEEDTLFNLFNSDEVQEGESTEVHKSTVWPAGPAVKKGAWFFQFRISQSTATTDGMMDVGILENMVHSDHHQYVDLKTIGKGCVFTSAGDIYLDGQLISGDQVKIPWIDGDVVTIAFSIDEGSYTVCLSKTDFTSSAMSTMFTGTFDQERGLKPYFSLAGNLLAFEVNFGDGREFWSSLMSQMNDLFAIEPKPLVEALLADATSLAWGYEFIAEPLSKLDMEMTRSFELLWSYTEEASRGSDISRKAWIWRAKSRDNYFPFGDILTSEPYPPARSLLIHKSQCKFPTEFQCVFASSKTNLVLWRPIPPDGYLAMGDVVFKGSFPCPPPQKDTIVCLPLWAVKACDLRHCTVIFKKVGEGKTMTNASLWSADHGLGMFFGSPYECRRSKADRNAEFKCDGVGDTYKLTVDVECLLHMHWYKEVHILNIPSLSWSMQLLSTLLEMTQLRAVVLTNKIFYSLIHYLKSSMALRPHSVVPLIVRMMRLASASNNPLSLSNMKSLCKAIISEAIVNIQKKVELSKPLMALVDLVVEVQTVNVLESSTKDCLTISRSIEKERVRLSLSSDSKAESGEFSGEKQEDNCAVEQSNILSIWWQRQPTPSNDIKIFRVIKYENLENMFHKESILLKLKQVLKFLHAINLPEKDAITTTFPLKLEKSYPKLMTSKMWFEKVSLCTMVESQHPYREKKCKRTVCFPGAQKLTVIFDSRCSLRPGDKLVIKDNATVVTIIGPIEGKEISNEVVFQSQTIIIDFISNPEIGETSSHEYGWAFLVRATGPVYESAETNIDLDTLQLQDLSINCDVAEEKTEDLPKKLEDKEQLDEVDKPNAPLPREESAASESQEALETSSEGSSAEQEDTSTLFDAEEVSADRPKTKRERREKEPTKVESKVSEEPPEVVAEPLVGPKEDSDVVLICTKGKLVKTGALVVPHASELEATVSYCISNITDNQLADYELVLVIYSADADSAASKTLQHRIDRTKTFSEILTILGCKLIYELYALRKVAFDHLHRKEAKEDEKEKSAEELEINSDKVNSDIEKEEEIILPVDAPVIVPEDYAERVDSWQCSVCTLINRNNETACTACLTSRAIESAEGAGEIDSGAGWWCPHCTFINALRATECGCCGRSLDSVSTDSPATTTDPPATALTADSASPTPVKVAEETSATTTVEIPAANIIIIKARGKLSNIAKFETRLESSIQSKGRIMTPLQTHHRVSSWTKAWDNALLEYLNNKAHHKGSDPLNIAEPFPISKEYLSIQGQCLSHLSLLDVMMRTHMIAAFNKLMELMLSLVDLSNDDPDSFAAMVRKSNAYILSHVKTPVLERAIASNAASSGTDIPASVTLDNFKALHSKDKGEKDPSTSQNTFVQCFRQLHTKDPALFRYIISADRVFQINFSEESGIDAGGVFREGVSRIMEDLFSDHFSLLLLSPNGQQAVHSGMDKYVPNPKHTGPLALEMFEFIGKLLGMSLRAKLCMAFEFPQLVWKKILGEEVSNSDLMEVDMITAKQLNSMEFCHEDPVDPVLDEEAFQERFPKLKFMYIGSDQVERDLGAGGAGKEVTFNNRREYCQAVYKARLAEFDAQCAAMQKGLSLVVPLKALRLFSACQVEELVCGSPRIDIALWKSHTESAGVPSITVELFWKVMESLTPKEQSDFIRFAWGRSRLPAKKEDFTVPMKLTSGGRAALPVSHTCFFSIEMPEYKTEEEMRRGLLTVIHFGVGGILNG